MTIFVSMIFVSCTMSSEEEPELLSTVPVPTIHPLFEGNSDASIHSGLNLDWTPTPLASLTPTFSQPIANEVSGTETRQGYLQALTGYTLSDLVKKPIYDDLVDANWRLLETDGMEVDLANTEVVHSGEYAISMTPLDAWQTMYFAVDENAEETYPQNDVIAISFWLNGGDDYIELDDLAFTFVGSNDYSYWVADDRSAYYDDEYPFSETALVWLDLNKSIPPNTWVEIEVYVHERIFDPSYRNITGFYLKNADDFFNTVYIDDINVVRFPDLDAGEVSESEEGSVAVEGQSTVDIAIDSSATSTIDISVTPVLTATSVITDPSGETACVVDPPFGWQIYSVQTGDAVSSLAQNNNIAVETLMSVNCLSDTVLSISQKLWLPSTGVEEPF
jgi:LysM repeat protein